MHQLPDMPLLHNLRALVLKSARPNPALVAAVIVAAVVVARPKDCLDIGLEKCWTEFQP